MPKRLRPSETTRSENWLRVAVKRCELLDKRIRERFSWPDSERIEWISPVKDAADHQFYEYYDQDFVDALGLHNLKVPLNTFWPAGGPRWDGLSTTGSGKVILVEAKAYIEESVDFRSHASDASLVRIRKAIAETKKAFRVRDDACWESPFYQYANRLAHLYFLRELNSVDAYLLFVYFANAGDVDKPTNADEWTGAIRLTKTIFGLHESGAARHVGEVIIDARELG